MGTLFFFSVIYLVTRLKYIIMFLHFYSANHMQHPFVTGQHVESHPVLRPSIMVGMSESIT